ncbi:DUF5343 domain-containing protein [Acidobacteria bacterium AH-259-O06]|nr:DUF5343 domain-containing protein [Acidobacteria bacterium AH-259-O06]
MGKRKSERIPPYVAYRTFSNFLAELKARGIPSRIDRSVMSHKSGTVQSQLLLTLSYLDLVKDLGRPTQKLRKLLESGDTERKAVLREIVESSYDFVFDTTFGLRTATSHQAEELFQKTGASGETVRRCIAFFLAAARDSGIPVSSYIKPHRRRKSTSRKRERAGRETPGADAPRLDDLAVERGSKKVNLKSGGSLKLELSINVFELDKKDREFIFSLIDQLKNYERENQA